MFGLSKREKNAKLVKKAIIEKSVGYGGLIQMNMIELNSCETEEQAEKIMMKIRKQYFNLVEKYVMDHMDDSRKKQYNDLKNNPSPEAKDFFEELNIEENGISAGMILALLNNLDTNSFDYDAECNKMSHIQNDMMNYELSKLDK